MEVGTDSSDEKSDFSLEGEDAKWAVPNQNGIAESNPDNAKAPKQVSFELRVTQPSEKRETSTSAIVIQEKARQKVSLGIGFSHMDWVRLSSASKDLAGTEGKVLKVTLSEVKRHCTSQRTILFI